jgi:branched-chain amino acid aminotransferase
MHDNAHIRLTLSRGLKVTSGMDPRLNQFGPTLIVLAEHKAPVYDKGGLSLITSSVRRFPADCMDPKIHHNNLIQSIMAKIEANYAGADDALMLDTRGFVAETNATHVFMVEDGVLKTSHTVACPEGVTRSTVLKLCREQNIPHEVTDLSQAEFYRAAEVFCTGTMGELAAVTTIDGRTIADGKMGPLTERLSGLYSELTKTESEAILG